MVICSVFTAYLQYSFCILVYRNYTASIQKLYCNYAEDYKE